MELPGNKIDLKERDFHPRPKTRKFAKILYFLIYIPTFANIILLSALIVKGLLIVLSENKINDPLSSGWFYAGLIIPLVFFGINVLFYRWGDYRSFEFDCFTQMSLLSVFTISVSLYALLLGLPIITIEPWLFLKLFLKGNVQLNSQLYFALAIVLDIIPLFVPIWGRHFRSRVRANWRKLWKSRRHRDLRSRISPTVHRSNFKLHFVWTRMKKYGHIWWVGLLFFSPLAAFVYFGVIKEALPEPRDQPFAILAYLVGTIILSLILVVAYLFIQYIRSQTRYVVNPFTIVDEDNAGPELRAIANQTTYAFVENLQRIAATLNQRQAETLNTREDNALQIFVTSGFGKEYGEQLQSLASIETEIQYAPITLPLGHLLPVLVFMLNETTVRGTVQRNKDGTIVVWVELHQRRSRQPITESVSYFPESPEQEIDQAAFGKKIHELAIKVVSRMSQSSTVATSWDSLQFFLEGLEASQQRNWWWAIDRYRRAIHLEETRRRSFGLGHYHLGTALVFQGRTALGLEHLNLAEASGPPLPEVYYMQALTQLYQNWDFIDERTFNDIVKTATVATELRKDFPEAYFLLGTIYYRYARQLQERLEEQKDLHTNRRYWKKLKQTINNGYYESIKNTRLALHYYRWQDSSLVNSQTRETSVPYPSDTRVSKKSAAYHQIGDGLRMLGFYAEAESYYRDVLAAFPSNLRTLIDMSKMRCFAGNWEDAYDYQYRKLLRRAEARMNPDSIFYAGWALAGISREQAWVSSFLSFLGTVWNCFLGWQWEAYLGKARLKDIYETPDPKTTAGQEAHQSTAVFQRILQRVFPSLFHKKSDLTLETMKELIRAFGFLDYALYQSPDYAAQWEYNNWLELFHHAASYYTNKKLSWKELLDQPLKNPETLAACLDDWLNWRIEGFGFAFSSHPHLDWKNSLSSPQPRDLVPLHQYLYGRMMVNRREFAKMFSKAKDAWRADRQRSNRRKAKNDWQTDPQQPDWYSRIAIIDEEDEQDANPATGEDLSTPLQFRWACLDLADPVYKDWQTSAQAWENALPANSGGSSGGSEGASSFGPITYGHRQAFEVFVELALLTCRLLSEGEAYEAISTVTKRTREIFGRWNKRWHAEFNDLNSEEPFRFSTQVLDYQIASLYAWEAYAQLQQSCHEETCARLLLRHPLVKSSINATAALENAYAMASKALSSVLEHPLARFVRAQVYRRQGKYREAADELLSLLATATPFDPLMHVVKFERAYNRPWYRPNTTQKGEKPFGPLKSLESVCGQLQYETIIDPAHLHLALADLFQEIQEYDLAMDHVSTASMLSPYLHLDAQCSLRMAELLERTGRYREADIVLDETRELSCYLSPIFVSTIASERPKVLECVLRTGIGNFNEALNEAERLDVKDLHLPSREKYRDYIKGQVKRFSVALDWISSDTRLPPTFNHDPENIRSRLETFLNDVPSRHSSVHEKLLALATAFYTDNQPARDGLLYKLLKEADLTVTGEYSPVIVKLSQLLALLVHDAQEHILLHCEIENNRLFNLIEHNTFATTEAAKKRRLGEKIKLPQLNGSAAEGGEEDDLTNRLVSFHNDIHLLRDFSYRLSPAERIAYKDRLAQYYDTLGWIMYRLEENKKAEKYLNKDALYYNQETPSVDYHLGRVYLRMAQELWQDTVRRGVKHIDKDEMRQMSRYLRSAYHHWKNASRLDEKGYLTTELHTMRLRLNEYQENWEKVIVHPIPNIENNGRNLNHNHELVS